MNVLYEPRGRVREYLPMASTVQSRLCILCKAHDYVDFWKVGNLNHNKAVEQSVDGPKFYKSSSS